MKKWLATLLAAILALMPAALAEKEALGKWNGKTVFSLSYDEKVYDIDTEELKDGDIEGLSYYQFSLYNDVFTVSCYIDYYKAMKGFSSYLAGEEDMQLYIEDMVEGYQSINPGMQVSLEEIYSVTVKNGGKEAHLPFIILRFVSKEEVFFRAEVVSHGYCIDFEASAEYSEVKLLQNLKGLLDRFVPISE